MIMQDYKNHKPKEPKAWKQVVGTLIFVSIVVLVYLIGVVL